MSSGPGIRAEPIGDIAAWIKPEGVFRRVPGARPDSGTTRRAATAIIRCLLSRIAGTISDPSPGGPEIYLAWPDTPVLTSSLTRQRKAFQPDADRRMAFRQPVGAVWRQVESR
jgi:hypothetical protein